MYTQGTGRTGVDAEEADDEGSQDCCEPPLPMFQRMGMGVVRKLWVPILPRPLAVWTEASLVI